MRTVVNALVRRKLFCTDMVYRASDELRKQFFFTDLHLKVFLKLLI